MTDHFILFTETITMRGTTKPIRQLPRRIFAPIASNGSIHFSRDFLFTI